MQYNNLSKTSLKVSKLSLGTMMFGGQTSEADSLKIMDYSFEHGINFLILQTRIIRVKAKRSSAKVSKGGVMRLFLRQRYAVLWVKTLITRD